MGRPKALLQIGGRTFLENILSVVRQSEIEQTVVVLGHHREDIQKALRLENAVINPAYEEGMITSIQAGIRSVQPTMDGALLFLVDHPVVDPTTLDVLIGNFRPNRIILPKFEGRRGHPVLFARNILDEILALPTTTGANAVLWKDPSRVVEVVVNDRGVVIDIDTPEDYQQLSS
jgi:molybdenum cofactor cytidylyltransferase